MMIYTLLKVLCMKLPCVCSVSHKKQVGTLSKLYFVTETNQVTQTKSLVILSQTIMNGNFKKRTKLAKKLKLIQSLWGKQLPQFLRPF